MKILVERILKTNEFTAGMLSIGGNYFCDTLEPPVRLTKIKGSTAIPAGTYNVIYTYSPRFKRKLPLLQNVTNFNGIRIHPGNSVSDTAGCILVGKTNDMKNLHDSRKASDDLNAIISSALDMGKSVEIEVR